MADRGPTSGTPGWVWVIGIILAVVVLLLVILTLIGGGNHGPGRHTPAGVADHYEFPAGFLVP